MVDGIAWLNSYEIVGNLSGVVLESLVTNRVFLGVVSIDSARGLFNDDLLEAEINADSPAAIARATVVADPSKFTAAEVARVSDFFFVDETITDSINVEDRAALAQHGVEVIEVQLWRVMGRRGPVAVRLVYGRLLGVRVREAEGGGFLRSSYLRSLSFPSAPLSVALSTRPSRAVADVPVRSRCDITMCHAAMP